ncbi:MAG: B12-binding domain-containing radical SAM protein [Desulfobacterales bacterium]|nr:B12-binding domain-containing radical SAM protein [Desulfobacterales bacterium]
MKIAIVTPKWTGTLGRYDFLAQVMVVHYPLNVAILAKYMEKNGNHVDIIDAQVENMSNSQVVDYLFQKKYDVIGYSITSPLYSLAIDIAAKIKLVLPKVIQIAGGAHINVLQKEAYQHCFDYLVFGEAEETIVELLRYIHEKSDINIEDIKGIIYKNKEDVVIQNESRPPVENLDTIEFQAAHLMNLPKYVVCEGVGKPSKNYISIMASRGCPYKCVFCAEPLNARKLRFRSAENIANEMEYHFKKSGVQHFFFVDSSLTLNREQIMQLSQILIDRNFPITWSGWTRVNLVDEDLFTLMKKSGFIVVSLGIESGDPRILKIIKKGITLEQIQNAFAIMNKLNIEAFCSAMIGLPGETRESVWRTVKFIRKTKGILYATLSMATPYPGTEMYEWLMQGKHGMKLLDPNLHLRSRWDDCSFSVNDLTPKDLIRLQRIGLFWIHFTPKRILFIIKMLGFKNVVRAFIEFIGLNRLINKRTRN